MEIWESHPQTKKFQSHSLIDSESTIDIAHHLLLSLPVFQYAVFLYPKEMVIADESRQIKGTNTDLFSAK